MPGECVYRDTPRTVPLRPWHDCPQCPHGCGGIGVICRYGAQDETLHCPGCGQGWDGTDAEIEQALIAETWWDAFYNHNSHSEHDFAVLNGGC